MTSQNIMLTVDYHDENCVIRRRDLATGKDAVRKVPTDPRMLHAVMTTAAKEAHARGVRSVWIQESTTGWARMQRLAAECGVEFVLANVLQRPLPPKAKRRKTDTIDTARLQRECLNGQLPRAHQPAPEWRQLRRLVSIRENLVRRRTALFNWLNRFFAHETWEPWPGCRFEERHRAVAAHPAVRDRPPGGELEARRTGRTRPPPGRGRSGDDRASSPLARLVAA